MTLPTLSDKFEQYDSALKFTKDKIDRSWEVARKGLERFYSKFLKDHVINYSNYFKLEGHCRELHKEIESAHRSSTIRFWAVDGACMKVEAADLSVFYGGSYVVKGRLRLTDNPPDVEYDESEPEDDSSIVAYLPLSAEDILSLCPEERFYINDKQRIDVTGLDTSLMLLAEVFMLYRGSNTIDHPHVIMWDHSLTSILAHASTNVTELNMSGIRTAGEELFFPDLLVGYSKPWNETMDVPSKKSHRLWERVISKIYESKDRRVKIHDLVKDTKMLRDAIISQIKILWEYDKYGKQHEKKNPESALLRFDGETLTLNPAYEYSPAKSKRLFENFCDSFFVKKDPSVFLYEYTDENGLKRESFLSGPQISFILALGIRFTFENCWGKNICLIGVAKDSATSYFTRNYLGVMRHAKGLDFESEIIPLTDRMVFEKIHLFDESLRGPWSSTEFDGTFMTLRMKKDDGDDEPRMQGVRGDILVQPNLIMKSLVQFHFEKYGEMEPSAGHVIFVDRLVHPDNQPPKYTVKEGDRDLGTISPYFFKNNKEKNKEQEKMIYILKVLTRNIFPDVIGYPDPLHQADRGAKAVLRMIEPMLRSSEKINRTDPFFRTLRQQRGG